MTRSDFNSQSLHQVQSLGDGALSECSRSPATCSITTLLKVVCLSLLMGGVASAGLGGRSVGGGGGRSFGGGGGRPAVGGARPGGGMPMTRPQSSVPHLGGGNFSRPSTLPQARPPGGAFPQVSRPNNSLPSVNRPNPVRPDISRPSVPRPENKLPSPNRPGQSRPSTGNLPQRPGNLPTTLPGLTTRPGTNNRPGTPGRPGMPDFGSLPSGRPSTGELGDFLGLDKPVRPGERPSTMPARPDVRPDRPGTLPNRPDPGLRPNIDIGQINVGNNTIISNRPQWAAIDRNSINQVNRRWQNSIANVPSTLPAYAGRWGNALRDHWRGQWYGRPPGYYGPRWWTNHPFHMCGWHYMYAYSRYPTYYWWRTPVYTQFATWFVWGEAMPQQPAYYDYGAGGNVTYVDNSVYIAGQPVATEEQFAQSAAVLATVDEPENEDAAQNSEWLPLGTFALMTDETDVETNRIVQLAVNKEGIVSGTLYNRATDRTQAIQGRVDKETQRVALRIGESEEVVAETGLYNLTQDEASLLVHYGADVRDAYLLVRLPSPEEQEAP